MSTVNVDGVGEIVLDSDEKIARVPGSTPGKGEIVAAYYTKAWKASTGKSPSGVTPDQRKRVAARLTYLGIGAPAPAPTSAARKPIVIGKRVV